MQQSDTRPIEASSSLVTHRTEAPGFARRPFPAGSLAGDILYGADAIAEFMHGDRRFRRAIYNLVENNRIPHFRVGATVCARRSVLLAWIEAQERGSSIKQALEEEARLPPSLPDADTR